MEEQKGERDAVLKFISYLATKHNIQSPLILNVDGLAIAGTVISYDKYVLHLQVAMGEAFPEGEDKESFNSLFDHALPVAHDKETVKPDDMYYLHLEDTHLYLGERPIPSGTNGQLWRVAISSVTGFSVELKTNTKWQQG